MAINLNDNIRILAPKPTDARYLKNLKPYLDIGEVEVEIPLAQRYIGLTVNIQGKEYWFKNNIEDGYLVPKDPTELDIDISGLVSGVTNLGYFSGGNGVQTLNVAHLGYNGDYESTYHSYYLDGSGVIKMGEVPRGGISRRAFVSSGNKTFIWSEINGELNGVVYYRGWLFIDANVNDSSTLETKPTLKRYYTNEDDVLTDISFNSGSDYEYGSLEFHVNGNLVGDGDLQLGSPIFTNIKNNVIGLKSLHGVGDLKITNDNYRVFLNVNVPVTGATSVGGGVSLLTNTIDNRNIQFKTIVAGDNIEIDTQSNQNQIIIHSVSGGTGGGGSGGIKKEIVKNGSWNEELVELEFPEESIGVRITYSIKNNTNYSMGDIYFTKNNDSEIFISSMFDDIENLVFIKEMNEIDLKIENSASDSSNDNIKINLLINYI